MSVKSHPTPNIFSKITLPWAAILGLVCFLSLGLLLNVSFLFLLFPASSFAVGLFLYFKDPTLYVGFVFWMWFIGPFVKRLIDYRAGYLTLGPFTFTPFLVTLVTIITLIKHLPTSSRKGGFPFLLCFGTVFYGIALGIIQNPVVYVLNSGGWLSSLLIGFHLYINWQYYPQYRHTIQRVFFWGILVMAVYGIIQFCIAPEWDRFWIISIDKGSFGSPEPFEIRTASTMESAHSLGYALTTGIILLFNDRQNPWRFPVLSIAFLTLLLTQARSVWLGLMISGIFLVASFRPNNQIKTVLGLAIISLLVIPLIFVEPFSTIIAERFDTFADIGQDVSLNARLEGYGRWMNIALIEVVGRGAGFQIIDRSIGSFDGTLMPMLLIFGWIGTIPYFSGLLLLLSKISQAKEKSCDSFVVTSRAVVFGLFAQIGFSYLFFGAMGMFFWGFMGISLAGQKYYFMQRRLEACSIS